MTGKIKVLFICHGNICRSPMAEFVFKDMIEKRGLRDLFEVASGATSNEECWGGHGNPIYPPAQRELKSHGIGKTGYTNFSNKRARQITRRDYLDYDYLLCADTANIRNTLRIVGSDPEKKIHLLMDFADPANYKKKGEIRTSNRSIADPWYSGDFRETWDDVNEGCAGFLEFLSFIGALKEGE